ncbi:MAG: alkaline phosphatase family protein, partial [Gammaproteobacteria bacterium]
MNMEYAKPSYDHSIVSLLSLLKATFNGSENTLPSSHCLNNEKYLNKLKDAQHIILLVIDGLGYNYVTKHPEFNTLNGNLLGCMESVFPTSTAPAITSFLTGNTPYEHGVCGWFQWFSRFGILAKALPFQTRAGSIPLEKFGLHAEKCFDFESFFSKIKTPSFNHTPVYIANSPFNEYATRGATSVPYASPKELVSNILDTVKRCRSNSYHYAYYPQFDSICHKFGLNSPEAQREAQNIDRWIESIHTGLKAHNAIAIVTADHGMIDTQASDRLQLNRFPEIYDLLTFPLSGEPRVSFCHVKRKHQHDFEEKFEEILGEYAYLMDSTEIIENGWLGPTQASRNQFLPHVLGDYTLIMKAQYTLSDVLPG